MNEIELDEAMVEEEKINRFLNMIALQYDGGLAQEYEKYYIAKCKEIERLNNIINELEKYMRYERINNGQIDEWTIMEIQMKLKELKSHKYIKVNEHYGIYGKMKEGK